MQQAPEPEENTALSLTILRLTTSSLRHYRRTFGLRSDRTALAALAAAVVSTPGGPGEAGAILVVRAEPEPVIGILVESEAVDPAGLHWQARSLETTIGRLRYIGYRQAEQDVGRLADALVRRFGLQEVRRMPFAAIPRGGLIVLGMLAAYLDLPPAHLSGGPDASTPLVVVDDCALTGARFGAFLAAHPAPHVIFAHLYSHPALRTAVAAREPRVLACFAAADLHDDGPERLGDEHAAARARWAERLGPARYWIGDGDRICFPWNEPDRLIWNPTTQKVETGWKLIPPQRCLKGRQRGGARRSQVQVQPPRGQGSLRPSHDVLFACWRSEVIAVRIDTGEIFRMPGSAGAMWQALVETGDLAAAHRQLTLRYQADAETLRSDLSNFLEILLQRDLMECTTP